jgi:glycosyltransferase involved in cell wall biosynthesis
VISEAIVADAPVIASRIAGNAGLLGDDYPGYFEPGDTRELARLLKRAESDAKFLDELRSHSRCLAAVFDPARENQAWADLLNELALERLEQIWGA